MKIPNSENGIIIPENLMKKEVNVEDVAIACAKMIEDELLWQKQSAFHSIAICQNSVGRFMKYGISFQAGRIDSDIYKGNIPYLNYFFIPYLLNSNVKNILLIGFGTGILVKQLEKLYAKTLKHFDAVDIEENILSIASRFFNFQESEIFNFHLQDALVFLKTNNKKYDLIIVDVAGNEGVDERFFEDEFFKNIKKALSKNGIFAFNSCANTDFDEEESSFYGFTVNQYKKYFNNFAVFDGKTSDMLYYKIFFDIDNRVIDVTNAIFIASDKYFDEKIFQNINPKNCIPIANLGVDIKDYLQDLHKIYKK